MKKNFFLTFLSEMFTVREIQVEKPKRIEVEKPKKEREIKIHVENVPKRREFQDFNLLDKDFGKLKLNDFGPRLAPNRR